MPRFSETVRAQIKAKLLLEGERLFTLHGIRKVTIDELAAAAMIAKPTFYTFYDGKESLFLEIAQGIRAKITAELDALLQANVALPGRERVRQVFAAMYAQLSHYPFLTRIDEDTAALIARRVPKERLAAFTGQTLDAARMLARHGIALRCPPEIAGHAFFALYRAWLSLNELDGDTRAEVAELLLDGALDRIVRD